MLINLSCKPQHTGHPSSGHDFLFLWSSEQHQQRHKTARGKNRVICNHTYLPASASKRCYLQIPGHPLPPARETVTFQQEETPCGFQGPGKNSSAVLWIYLSQYICYFMNYNLGFYYSFSQGYCEVRNMSNFSLLLSYTSIIMIIISSSCRDLSHRMSFQLECCEVQLRKKKKKKKTLKRIH